MAEQDVELQANPGAPGAAAAIPDGGAPPAVGADQAEAGAAPSAPAQAAANLDDDPRFRKWKSTMDRHLGQAEARRAQAEQRLAQLETTLEEATLRNASPREQAEYYKAKVASARTAEAQGAEANAAVTTMQTEALALLESLGVDPEDPALDWTGGPTPEGLVALTKSAAALAVGKLASAREQTQSVADTARRDGKIDALRETGVTKTTVASGKASTNPIEDISDASELLRMALRGK